MATNPDKIFAKLLLDKPLTVTQSTEVTSWMDSSESDKLVAWIFANIKSSKSRAKVVKATTNLLRNGNVKTKLGILVILIYAPPSILKYPILQETICLCFSEAAVRLNVTQVLAKLSRMGHAKSKRLLIKAKNDPDPSIRKNALALLSK